MAASEVPMMQSIRDHFGYFASLADSLGKPIEQTETVLVWRFVIVSMNGARLAQIVEQQFCDRLQTCQSNLPDDIQIILAVDNEVLHYDWKAAPNAAWDALRRNVNIGPISLELTLNKATLVERLFGLHEGIRPIVFSHSTASCDCLRALLATPQDFERIIWHLAKNGPDGIPPLPRAVFAVLDATGQARSDSLSIMGNDVDFNAIEAVGEALPAFYSFEKARDKLYWESVWVRRITPHDLRLEPPVGFSQVELVRVMDAHAVNISLLYLANRSWQSGSTIVARFATDHNRFDVELFSPNSDLSCLDPKRVRCFLDLLDFAYQTERFDDRLSFAQAALTVVVSPGEDRRISAAEILNNASRIYESANWHWRSFCEERINKYREDAEEVEEDVQAVSEQFDATSMRMIEDMSKAVLSAIGAIITAFIAAGLKRETSATAFQIVLAVFFLYLALVAGWMSLRFVYDRFWSTKKWFSKKLSRHEAVLGPSRVKELVGNTVTLAEARFRRWFAVSILVYTLFGVTLILLIWYAPLFLFK